MAKITKRMKAIKAGVDSNRFYPIDDAIVLLKQFATAKFVESVDVAVNLGIDPRKSDQNVRGDCVATWNRSQCTSRCIYSRCKC